SQVEAFLAETVPVAEETAVSVSRVLDVVGLDEDARARLRDLLVG
ncbi:protein-tyrosine-phosphatase, partial [bacterium]